MADFIYTLDCITYNGGEIGLHGYTNQTNDEISLKGHEFGKDTPDVTRLRERVRTALKLARDVDIETDGIPGFQYDDASPLKKITNALEEKGYRMSYETILNYFLYFEILTLINKLGEEH